jgi:hypothetical protein
MMKDEVKSILYKALADANKTDKHFSKHHTLVDFVFDNTHLTYKYILFTALAAKATNENINPLALQAKSELSGAYDARSICHGVIVKFEMTELGKALGGSNEPYLNKPARFPELSKTNAVRRGRDQEILHRLCDDLPKIKSSEEAYDSLVYAIQKLLVIKAQKELITNFNILTSNTDAARLYKFIDTLLRENHEGEILTLVIAGLYELYMESICDEYFVDVHPVNQSGASSKEISDLDVYKNGVHFLSNELKDKPFNDSDLRHAADKVAISGKNQMHFIVGRHSGYDHTLINECISDYLAKGFVINVVPVDCFVLTLLNLIENTDVDRYVKYILQTAVETKFKEKTISFIEDTSHKQFATKQRI